jgi:hypothetical protein
MPRLGGACSIESLNNYGLSSSPPALSLSVINVVKLPCQHSFTHDPQSLLRPQVRDDKTVETVARLQTLIMQEAESLPKLSRLEVHGWLWLRLRSARYD